MIDGSCPAHLLQFVLAKGAEAVSFGRVGLVAAPSSGLGNNTE
jgi:hypothetical protein